MSSKDALIDAIHEGDLDVISKEIADGADPNAANEAFLEFLSRHDFARRATGVPGHDLRGERVYRLVPYVRWLTDTD